jgi:hypothetical protein
MVAGQGTFINDMLKRCGLQNVFDEGRCALPGDSRPRTSLKSDPDVILLSSEPYPFNEEHMARAEHDLPRDPGPYRGRRVVQLVAVTCEADYFGTVLAYFSGILNGLNGCILKWSYQRSSGPTFRARPRTHRFAHSVPSILLLLVLCSPW